MRDRLLMLAILVASLGVLLAGCNKSNPTTGDDPAGKAAVDAAGGPPPKDAAPTRDAPGRGNSHATEPGGASGGH